MAFRNYWTKRGFDLSEPQFPLVAVVFADRAAYLKYSRGELGDAAESIIAYFSLDTNRMTMYDLTGTERGGRGGHGGSAAQINQILARPEAQLTVATIVHEATHQIAFNSGLHARLSDCPKWFSEGIAVYFETPDLHSAKGGGDRGDQPAAAGAVSAVSSQPPPRLAGDPDPHEQAVQRSETGRWTPTPRPGR